MDPAKQTAKPADVSDLNLPKETKIFIIKDAIQTIVNSIYRQTIDARIAKRINDEQLIGAAKTQLQKLEGMKIEYEKELSLVEKE